MEEIKIIYKDENLLVADKPAGVVVFPEGQALLSGEKTLIDFLVEKYPELKSVGEAPRYGIVHRLDKDTSGVLLVAKTSEALIFLQKQFINRRVEKNYTALSVGEIKEEWGEIKTLIGRSKSDPRKQKVYPLTDQNPKGKRDAITLYKVIARYKNPPSLKLRKGNKVNGFTLLEVKIKTGRRHQIRCHLSYLKHPVAGDKLYGFKNQPIPEGLTRQFLHASYLKIQLPNSSGQPNGKTEEFKSELPEEFKRILENLKK